MRGYVLAGGLSSRMGVDKARLPSKGWPIAVRLCERMREAGLEPRLIRRVPDGLPWTYPNGEPVRVIYEAEHTLRHPLQGLLTAARDAGQPFLIVPCDLWSITAASLRLLADVGCVASGHPLVGVFEPDIRGLESAIEAGTSARSYASRRPRFPLPELELVDRNRGGGPWPPELLLRRLEGVGGVDLQGVLRGEEERLQSRGVVVPRASLYVDVLKQGEEP